MSELETSTLTAELRQAQMPSGSGTGKLSPEIQQDLYRRLGGVALVYAGAWIANFLYFNLTPHPIMSQRERFWDVITLVCTAAGIAVYIACRNRHIPAAAFANLASAFEIAGAVGIMAGAFGWEHHGAEFLERVARAFDIDLGEILTRVVEPLDREGTRILYAEGVNWVSVWLLTFPLVVPAPLLRTAVVTLLTAATVPAVLLTSLLVNGVPESVRPWIFPYIMELTVPTFICAGIAIFGSRVVYKLTRDLSRARQMGSYQLIEKIGAGGMGEVWKAKHRLLARPAAIKLIRAEAVGANRNASRTALQRFEREAQATSGLSSPHSIDLYDFGMADDGTFYYVMELLQGVDLKKLVEDYGPMPAERAIHILRQVCHSLTDAHLMGIVHRDIKPGNIFVCRSGPEFDFVKVLDFGLVKHVGDLEPGASQLTMEGIASGTPAFMAPEMAYDNRRVDARADIYALGCVAYWLLTGRLVFEAESAMAVVLRHAQDSPPPPSTRTELEIPADLEQLVLLCLRKRPEERPQSAPLLSHRLDACAASLPSWTEERAFQWWQIHLPHLAQAPNTRAGVALLP